MAAQAGWKHEGKWRWALFAGYRTEHRRGKEHIAGSSSSTEYKSLITLSMYQNNKADYHLGGALSTGNQSKIMLNAQLGWLNDYSEYIDLRREMAFAKTYGRLGWQWLWCNKTQQKHQKHSTMANRMEHKCCLISTTTLNELLCHTPLWISKITQLVNNIYATKNSASLDFSNTMHRLSSAQTVERGRRFPKNSLRL